MDEAWAGDDVARAAQAKKGSPFLSTEQAAFYLGLAIIIISCVHRFAPRPAAAPRAARHGGRPTARAAA